MRGRVNSVTFSSGGGDTPEGSTVLPVNDVVLWQQCAGISSPSYNTLAGVLSDHSLLLTLMADNNAVDYLVRCTDWATEKELVPVMTSNTTPSGVASASSAYEDREQDQPYHAFDGSTSTAWSPNTRNNSNYLQYTFDNTLSFYKFSITTNNRYTDESVINTLSIYIGDSDQTLTEVYSYNPNQVVISKTDTFDFTSGKVCRVVIEQSQGYKYCSVSSLQFYSASITSSENAMSAIGENDYCAERLLANATWRDAICNSTYFEDVLDVKVPTMTSASTPSGEAYGTAVASWSIPTAAYRAFDGNTTNSCWAGNGGTYPAFVCYGFPSPVSVYKISSYCSGGYSSSVTYVHRYQASNDGNVWDNLTESANVTFAGFEFQQLNNVVAGSPSYRYYRQQIVSCASGSNYYTFGIYALQFYGRSTNPVQTWLKAGHVDAAYTTLNEVLNDNRALLTLMSSNAAVDFLLGQVGWASDICSNAEAMSAIGLNNYASNTLLANETWCSAICNSTYFESVLNTKVPAMTSNTTPSGVAFGDATRGTGYEFYRAFDNSDSTLWDSGTSAFPHNVGYQFTTFVSIHKMVLTYVDTTGGGFVKDFIVQGSNDSFTNDVQDVFSGTGIDTTAKVVGTSVFANSIKRQSFRLNVLNNYKTGNNRCALYEVQFYGRQDV